MSIVCDNDKYYIDGGYAINHVKNGVSIEKHTHDFVEFTYIYRGKCVHNIDGIDYPAAKGDLVFINYNRVHSITCDDDFEYADILIKPEGWEAEYTKSVQLLHHTNETYPEAFSNLKLTAAEGDVEAINRIPIVVEVGNFAMPVTIPLVLLG